MDPAELAKLAKLTISKPREADGLWTSRSPVLLPPSPIPGQDNVPTFTQSSAPILDRYNFGLCANESGDVYFYGGVTKGQNDSQLYHYSTKDNTVTPLQCSGTSPGYRYRHAMTLVGDIIALHGGVGNDRDLYLLNLGVCLCDIVSRQWSKIPASDDAPISVFRHATATVGTTIYIFGGYSSVGSVSSELWAIDLSRLRTETPKWELLKPSSQNQPKARYTTSLVSHLDQLFVFGGFYAMNDVWSFDIKSRTWTELQCTGDVPSPRGGHIAAILDDVMYIIGGSDKDSSLRGDDLGDNFTLKIPERRWFKLKNTSNAPTPRYHHAGTCMGTEIFIFGGDLGGVSEKHPIHILNTNYIDNPNPHAPECLEETDIEFQAMLSQKESENDLQEAETSKRNQIVSHILKYPSKIESLAQLQRADAQMIVDFLAYELGCQDAIQSNTDKRHILHFLNKLAKSAQVFPKSTELSDVQCILTTPLNVQGGYGLIYKGDFRGQTVCVKAVHVGTKSGKKSRGSKKSRTDDSSQGDKRLRAQAGETVLLSHVSHPNIIPLYGTYLSTEESPRICIVSPWMENGDLATYFEKFPDTTIIPLASDMAAGLGFLHDMGIVHADLKAANVLVSRSQRAMLTDFGISTVLHTNVGTTTAGDFTGTTYWMAPELLVASANRQPPRPTKESDMWGFACVCYEMFAGDSPFADREFTPVHLMMAFVATRRITPLRPNEESGPINVDGDPISVDDEPWIPLAEKCWSYDPGERPTAAEALQSLKELNVQDDRPSMDEELAAFKAIKESRVKVEIDYSRVLSIVQNT